MHTDEYEISVGREIALCRKIVKRLRGRLDKKEKKFGMTTEAFLQGPGRDPEAEENRDYVRWREDYKEMQIWERSLHEYEEALRMVKKT